MGASVSIASSELGDIIAGVLILVVVVLVLIRVGSGGDRET